MIVTVDVSIDIDDFLSQVGSIKELLKRIDEEEILEYADDLGWFSEESKYNKYHMNNMLDQQKLDLFVAHISNVSLEDVEKLVGTRFT